MNRYKGDLPQPFLASFATSVHKCQFCIMTVQFQDASLSSEKVFLRNSATARSCLRKSAYFSACRYYLNVTCILPLGSTKESIAHAKESFDSLEPSSLYRTKCCIDRINFTPCKRSISLSIHYFSISRRLLVMQNTMRSEDFFHFLSNNDQISSSCSLWCSSRLEWASS